MSTKKKSSKQTAAASCATTPAQACATGRFGEVRGMIVSTREGIAKSVNACLTLLCREVGDRIRRDALKKKRALYGEQIVAALARQLGWTHFTLLIPISGPLKRDSYAEMCRMEGWKTQTLRRKIDSKVYERTVLSKKPESLIRQELKALRAEDRMTPDLVLRDPCILDFLGLKKEEAIELLDIEKDGIRVSSFWTDVLPKEQLRQKVHEAVVRARVRLGDGAHKPLSR